MSHFVDKFQLWTIKRTTTSSFRSNFLEPLVEKKTKGVGNAKKLFKHAIKKYTKGKKGEKSKTCYLLHANDSFLGRIILHPLHD